MKIRQAKKIMKKRYAPLRRYNKHPALFWQEIPNVDGYWCKKNQFHNRDHRITKAIRLTNRWNARKIEKQFEKYGL